MSNTTIQKFLLGVFDDEATLIKAVKSLRQNDVNIHDVYTPYAVHGLDDAMGIKRTRLPYVCMIAGCFGLLLALAFQTWVFTSSWPVNVGGKPHNAFPAFMPITFELTVLVGGLVTVAAFLLRSRLLPAAVPVLLDQGITDDRFVIAIAKTDASLDVSKTTKVLMEQGACDVREGEVES